MTLASLVLVIIRDISEIRGQILQPRISRMPRIMRTEHFQNGPNRHIASNFSVASQGIAPAESNATWKGGPH